MREDLFATKAIIIGQVIDGDCGDGRAFGLAGVRVLLEDGTYVVTDKDGKYHIEGVEPGTHVVQLDLTSVPETHEVISCEENTRHAGTAFSQFVDVHGGTMWRADFHVAKKPPLSNPVTLRLDGATDPAAGTCTNFALSLSSGAIPLGAITAVVTLPDGLKFLADSARLDGTPIATTDVDGALTFRLGDSQAAFAHSLTFAADDIEGRAATVKALAMFEVDGKRLRTPVVSYTVNSIPSAAGVHDGNITVVEVTAKRTLIPQTTLRNTAVGGRKNPGVRCGMACQADARTRQSSGRCRMRIRAYPPCGLSSNTHRNKGWR